MVNTVRPNASATPSRPMPTFGNPAARTALPHPPRTSQNVPRNSTLYCFISSSYRPRNNPVTNGRSIFREFIFVWYRLSLILPSLRFQSSLPRYPAFLASSSDMNFATFSFAVELAFLVNFAGEVNPDHSLCFRVSNLFVRGCYGLLASLCA